MAKDNISAKFLIHLIGERPALWDRTSEEYRDRSLRETSWREICTFVNENFERLTPNSKAEFTRMIMKKWTSIRDSWVRSMKTGYDEKTMKPTKPYIYHNDLQFLQKIFTIKPKRNDFKLSYLSNEELYGYKTETQYSIGALNYSDSNGEEGEEVVEAPDNHNENTETDKQETETKTEPTVMIENHEDNTTDNDDWPMNDVDATPIAELNKADNENEHKRSITSPPIKKPRIMTNCNSNYQGTIQTPAASQYRTKPATYLPPLTKRPSTTFSANNYLDDNRHLNFFRGILPSINGLDEDHTLQFQLGVITLIQNLRESQNCQTMSKSVRKQSTFRSRKRKNKISADDNHEWPEPTMNVSKTYLRKSTGNASDPIAADESEDSTD